MSEKRFDDELEEPSDGLEDQEEDELDRSDGEPWEKTGSGYAEENPATRRRPSQPPRHASPTGSNDGQRPGSASAVRAQPPAPTAATTAGNRSPAATA